MRALILALALVLVPACGLFGSKGDQAAMIETSKALSFNGAVRALEVVDHMEATRQDAIKAPTDADVKRAEANRDRLLRARDALALLESYIKGEKKGDQKKALRDAVEALRLVVAELKADGIAIPQRVVDGLQVAALFAGV